MQRARFGLALSEDDKFFASPGFRQEIDLRFLVLALHWLREACALAAGLTNDRRLMGALARFDSAVPNAKDMRDVGEHLRDYLRGRGKLQEPDVRRVRAARSLPDVGRDEKLGVRTWDSTHFEWADMSIDVEQVLKSAEGLYAALRTAMDRDHV